MPELTPADEIRQAATTLRDTAEPALHGPWEVDEDGTAIFSAELTPDGVACVAPQVAEEDAAWIALMHPAVAEPLAAWLEAPAQVADGLAVHGYPSGVIEAACGHALATARAINGSAS